MSHESNGELEKARKIADEIVQRLKRDPEFRQRVHENPEASLRSAGLPDVLVDDLASGVRGSAGPSSPQPRGVCTYTCIKNTSECTKSYLV